MKEILLLAHITGGAVALICDALAVSSKKGFNFLRKVGRIYALGMATIGITSVSMAIISDIMFLFLIALFSSYLVFACWRFTVNLSGRAKQVGLVCSVYYTVNSNHHDYRRLYFVC